MLWITHTHDIKIASAIKAHGSDGKWRLNMKNIILFILLLSSGFLKSTSASDFPESFRAISVQHQGRIKPLDTVARAYMMMFSEKSKLDGKEGCEWLVAVWSDPEKAADMPVFRIRNPEVLSALGLEKDEKQLYSYRQVKPALQKMQGTIQQLAGTQREQRSPTESQLVDLHFKT